MANFDPRPHVAPCACELCQEWARAVVSTKAERKPDRMPQLTEKPDMPLADFMTRIIAVACKATGLTEEQLRARAADIGSDIPEIRPERVSRDAVLNRGVPEIHVKSVYDKDPVDCQALDAIRAFVGDQRTVLVLSGGVGIRKTGSACWALTQKAGRFCTASEALRLAGSKLPDDIDLWRRVRNAHFLVLDDLGGEYPDDKGWGVSVFNGLLDHRYSNGLKTIITTNLKADRFKQDYGERVADRIRETGEFLPLKDLSSVRKKAS